MERTTTFFGTGGAPWRRSWPDPRAHLDRPWNARRPDFGGRRRPPAPRAHRCRTEGRREAHPTWETDSQAAHGAWNDPATRAVSPPPRGVVLVGFTDQPSLITQEPGAHPFGNPQPGWEPVPAERGAPVDGGVPQRPDEYNGGQSINGYWMEDTHGRLGVSITAFGPYTLPGRSTSTDWPATPRSPGQDSRCPLGDVCNKDIRTDGRALWLRRGAGDRSPSSTSSSTSPPGTTSRRPGRSSGEMIFETREDVPAASGPPEPEERRQLLNNAGEPMPNWSPTRYVPWTSWRAAANHWPNAGGGYAPTQAESSGQSVYAHEFSHVLGLPDNYNNPFADNRASWHRLLGDDEPRDVQRPGRHAQPLAGAERRAVPASAPPHAPLQEPARRSRQRRASHSSSANKLANQGIAVTTIEGALVRPRRTTLSDSGHFGEGGYTAGKCEQPRTRPVLVPAGRLSERLHDGGRRPGGQRLLHARATASCCRRAATAGTPRGVDHRRQPTGHRHDRLLPARRHARARSSAETPSAQRRDLPRGHELGQRVRVHRQFNRLHFYILDTHRDEDGVLYYDIGVRRFDGAGLRARHGTRTREYTTPQVAGFGYVNFPLTNTGEAGEGIFDSDIYRLSANHGERQLGSHSSQRPAASAAGETIETVAHVRRTQDGGAGSTIVTLSATSESDPSQTATSTCAVDAGDPVDPGDPVDVAVARHARAQTASRPRSRSPRPPS